MKHIALRGKMTIKKWGFKGKKWAIGVEKIRTANQSRKAKWCKMQVLFIKTDKAKDMKCYK